MALHDLLVGVDQVAEQLDRDARIRGGSGQFLGCVEQRVELLAGHAQHDPAVHGDEPSIRVEGEAFVVGLAGQALDRLVVESQVEDGVHHPRHRELGTGTDRHQQRVIGVADPLAHRLLQAGAGLGDLRRKSFGPAALHVVPARRGGDGEPRRDGELQHRRHLGQVGSLAAEEVLHLHRGLAVGVVEVEHERHQEGSPRGIRGRNEQRTACVLTGNPTPVTTRVMRPFLLALDLVAAGVGHIGRWHRARLGQHRPSNRIMT